MCFTCKIESCITLFILAKMWHDRLALPFMWDFSLRIPAARPLFHKLRSNTIYIVCGRAKMRFCRTQNFTAAENIFIFWVLKNRLNPWSQDGSFKNTAKWEYKHRLTLSSRILWTWLFQLTLLTVTLQESSSLSDLKMLFPLTYP